MQYTTLGRTGLTVSVAGLGTGGYSRVGVSYGRSAAEAIELIDAALELGVNFIDTARAYGTEELVGNALRGRRDEVVLSTKGHVIANPFTDEPPQYLDPQTIQKHIEDSLALLKTDYIDVYHVHGVELHEYEQCLARAVPVLERMREQGKIRFLGITERFAADTDHKMMNRALDDDTWDVVMIGFNILNPSARHVLLEKTQQKAVGTLAAFVVRRALTSAEALRTALEKARASGRLRNREVGDEPLAFLTESGGAASLVEAGYRFARHEPGIDLVLTGTGSLAHLRENIDAINKPALWATCLSKLEALFGDEDGMSGD